MKSEPSIDLGLKEKKKMISVSKEFEKDINTLFYAAGHFEFRHLWQEGVKQIDEVTHYLPRVGTKHRRVLKDGQVIMFSSSFSYGPERIVYAETDEKRRTSTYFIFEKIANERTRLTLEFYLKKNPVLQAIFELSMKKSTEKNFTKSLENLQEFIKNVELPVEVD
jgi:hypothetical protein